MRVSKTDSGEIQTANDISRYKIRNDGFQEQFEACGSNIRWVCVTAVHVEVLTARKSGSDGENPT